MGSCKCCAQNKFGSVLSTALAAALFWASGWMRPGLVEVAGCWEGFGFREGG